MTQNKLQEKAWIIQRCVNAYKNEWEDWPGYCENLMTRNEMMKALKKCENSYSVYEFRGHKIMQATNSEKPS